MQNFNQQKLLEKIGISQNYLFDRSKNNSSEIYDKKLLPFYDDVAWMGKLESNKEQSQKKLISDFNSH